MADLIATAAYLPRVLWRMQGAEHMALPTPPESFGTEAIARAIAADLR